jgi:SAM-dependent methyltransferase
VSTAITIKQPSVGPRQYWNARAARFAARGAGLAAVCSYGMPGFYNWHIDLLQKRALGPWLFRDVVGAALEIGCGVGRWTRQLARAGQHVVGIDLSSVMVQEAKRRAVAEGVDARCQFAVADAADIPLRRRFDRIVGVTVLQHILDSQRLHACLGRLRESLAENGTIVLLEAAPSRPVDRCDSGVFVARSENSYLDAFAAAGLRCVSIAAVDPAPFKIWFLPWYRRLPRPLATPALFVVTALTLPIDLAFAPWGRATSWHKVFVLTHKGDRP